MKETTSLIDDQYSGRISNNKAIICANEFTLEKIESGEIKNLESSEDLEIHEISNIKDPYKKLEVLDHESCNPWL